MPAALGNFVNSSTAEVDPMVGKVFNIGHRTIKVLSKISEGTIDLID
jgi:hypothetical protein